MQSLGRQRFLPFWLLNTRLMSTDLVILHVYYPDMCHKLSSAHQSIQNSLPAGGQVPLINRMGSMAGLPPPPGSATAVSLLLPWSAQSRSLVSSAAFCSLRTAVTADRRCAILKLVRTSSWHCCVCVLMRKNAQLTYTKSASRNATKKCSLTYSETINFRLTDCVIGHVPREKQRTHHLHQSVVVSPAGLSPAGPVF